IGPQEKLNIPRPTAVVPEPDFTGQSNINHPTVNEWDRSEFDPNAQKVNAVANAVAEFGSPPPPVLDAPSITKWIGTKASQVVRGADPGARLVNEQLI